MPKLKILHVISGLGTGGAERMLVKLILSTTQIFEHRVVSVDDIDTQGEVLQRHGISITSLNFKHKNFLNALGQTARTKNIIKEWNPDIIQGWMYHGNLFAWYFRYDDKPLFFNIRHSLHNPSHEKYHTRLAIWLNARLSTSTQHVIYNSTVSTAQHEKVNFDQSKSKFIPNGFDTDLFSPDNGIRNMVRDELGIPQHTFLFGQIGRLHPMKGHMTLLRSIQQVIRKLEDAHFILMGNGVSSDPQIKNYILEHDLNPFVTLIDERDDVDRILKSLDICIMPSLWGEAFPNIIGEAMSSQVPCIVTEVGDAGLLVGDSGFVVRAGDIDALSDAILKSRRLSEQRLTELGILARTRIIDHFSLNHISKMYVDTYMGAIQS